MSVDLRPLLASDLPAAAALCQATIPHLPFTPDILAERIVDDVDFDPELNLTAWVGDDLVGLACGAPANTHLQCPAGVKLFTVRADQRRRGLATAMFDGIESGLAARGASEAMAVIAGNNRFRQGLDLRYTEAVCFLEDRGYGRVGDGMDMDVDLAAQTFDTDDAERALARRLGVTVRRAHERDRAGVWDYISAEFRMSRPGATEVGRRWAYLAQLALDRAPVRLQLAVRETQIVGFVATQAAAPGRLGPMGVSRELRGSGVGSVLVRRGLADLKADGLKTGVIYGAGPYAFYSRTVDARISAVFWRLRKTLADD